MRLTQADMCATCSFYAILAPARIKQDFIVQLWYQFETSHKLACCCSGEAQILVEIPAPQFRLRVRFAVLDCYTYTSFSLCISPHYVIFFSREKEDYNYRATNHKTRFRFGLCNLAVFPALVTGRRPGGPQLVDTKSTATFHSCYASRWTNVHPAPY